MNDIMDLDLVLLKSKIENMDKQHHIEILKIMKTKSNIKINENKSGVYINLSLLPPTVIEEIIKYMNYVNDQETLLNPVEAQKETYKNSFFDKEDLYYSSV
jgi:hypothetical protein